MEAEVPHVRDDRRLIEDYLPIQAISKEASREKNIRKGHISTLHLWWARRPLVACRAAVYGALVPASQFVPANGPDNKKQSLGRANAARFVTDLCKYPGGPRVIAEAQKHILDAHAERLTAELAEAAETDQWPAWVDEFKWPKDEKQVTRNDIEKGRAPRPRVLDMFAGGGAIPLEALRLGCEAYALDLNPVAHIIELCTLVYPQKYGKPDSTARGMTGPKNANGETTWGGLAEEVRHWGNWVLEKVKAEIGDLYPLIPDPAYKGKRAAAPDPELFQTATKKEDVPRGYLIPVAYLWTRTVKCKNPACGATVPLVKQTWLCKKKGRYAALRVVAPMGAKHVRFEVVEHPKESDFDFDPASFSSAGNATCPFCKTVCDAEYVQREGVEGRMGRQIMGCACVRAGRPGKVYTGSRVASEAIPEDRIAKRVALLAQKHSAALPSEPINPVRPSPNARGISPITRYGVTNFGAMFDPRSTAALMTIARTIADIGEAEDEHAIGVAACLALWLDRVADKLSNFTRWDNTRENSQGTWGRHALPMVWDYVEPNPIGKSSGGADGALEWVVDALAELGVATCPATIMRGSASALPLDAESIDAAVTDPPYYDNVPYADISDFFYVWLKRSLGGLFPTDFATELTPKKAEATALSGRHGGDMTKATREYEGIMQASLAEAHRVLKPGSCLVIIYAHKTTLGWSTLVESLRTAGFVVTEAWPLDTEMGGRLIARDASALASSITLVARKRSITAGAGDYDKEVRPALERVVTERIATLWGHGVTGADLVIAAVGAGLRAFTKYERVEYANGEEVPADKFLGEVEGVVLDLMLQQIVGKVARGVTSVDAPSRFYVLWRYVYKAAAIEAGEAIVFMYGQHVELDGQMGLASGRNPLVEKKKSTYRLRDFTERGEDEKLGLPPENGQPGDTAPLIDALHRVLWIMENRPRTMTEFLRESRVNRDQLRVLAQALAGPALKGSELGDVSGGEELAALTKLTANWKSVIEDALGSLETGRMESAREQSRRGSR